MSLRRLPVAVSLAVSLLGALSFTPVAAQSGAGPVPSQQLSRVDVYWDAWGVPHIYGKTDEQALYGLGYATARMRFFQMSWHRLIAYGHLAESFGPGTHVSGNPPVSTDTFVESDRKARLFGWRRYAQKVVADLALAHPSSPEAEALRMLEAYAAGVNHYISTATQFHDHFTTHGVPIKPWSAADCVAVWARMGSFFAPSGLDEAAKLKTLQDNIHLPQFDLDRLILGAAVCDDDAATVVQSDVPAAVQSDLAAYAALHNLDASGNCPLGEGAPAFSEAWAVAGTHTTNGKAVVVAEPRINLFVPNTLLEWHVTGKTFSVRGAGIPGSPNVFFGSTDHMAWGLTALGMDQADLFLLETDPVGHPDMYELDLAWLPWDVDETETIFVNDVANGVSYPSVPVRYRESYWGPVVTEIVAQTQGEEFSRKALPFADTSSESTVGFLAMYRATTLEAFDTALADWSYPSVNVVMGASDGRIGYRANGHLPVRNPTHPYAGTVAMRGSKAIHDWIDVLPHDLLPGVHDPAKGWIHSGNHMPVGSWYPIPNRPGPAGETHRSRRVREGLEALSYPAAPTDIGRLHADTIVSPARDMTILADHIDVHQAGNLGGNALLALPHLRNWLAAGATMDNVHETTLLAHVMRAYFRDDSAGVDLVDGYGGGDAGMSLWLKTMFAKIDQGVALSADDMAFIDWTLDDAWVNLVDTLAGTGIGHQDTLGWQTWYASNIQTPSFEGYRSLGIKPGLGLGPPYQAPLLLTTHGNTINHSSAQTYSQFVQVGLTDAALSILPPGQAESDHEFPAHQDDQAAIWAQGALRSSPTTLPAIKAQGPWSKETILYVP